MSLIGKTCRRVQCLKTCPTTTNWRLNTLKNLFYLIFRMEVEDETEDDSEDNGEEPSNELIQFERQLLESYQNNILSQLNDDWIVLCKDSDGFAEDFDQTRTNSSSEYLPVDRRPGDQTRAYESQLAFASNAKVQSNQYSYEPKTRPNDQSEHCSVSSMSSDFPNTCPINGCRKSFPNKYKYSQHMEACHSEKRFVCQFPGCNYKTSLKYNLDTHFAVHSTERNHVCHHSDCWKSFKSIHELNKHIKRVHLTPKKRVMMSHTRGASGKRYACQWPGCRYTTVHASSISIHKARAQR